MKRTVRLLALVAGTIVFYTFFWGENLGINTLIYSVIMFGLVFYLQADSFKKKNIFIALVGTLISAVLVVYYNSGTSKFAFICSFILTLGFIFQPSLRSVLTSWSAGFLNFFVAPRLLALDLKSKKENRKGKTSFWRWLKLFLFPILILLVFYFIFKGANPVFHKFTADIGKSIRVFLEELFINYTWAQFFFLVLGFSITVGIIYNAKLDFFTSSESKRNEHISRESIKAKRKRFGKFLALQNEYKRALILVILINILVLIVNIIDINWIWLNFELKEGMDLKQLVHEGTYLLILSILLSMTLILIYFRGNLNFFSKNKLLKYGVYAWLGQNIIMIISVIIRNYHYINYFGLAYKRIGVLIFLCLTIVGLITIFLKIQKKRSGFYLLKTNAWAVFLMMIFISFFNWDIIITKHNLDHRFPENMEADFLLRMSDNTLYILDENRDKFINSNFLKNENSIEILDQRIEDFIYSKEEKSWLSWSYASSNSYENLITIAQRIKQ